LPVEGGGLLGGGFDGGGLLGGGFEGGVDVPSGDHRLAVVGFQPVVE
jgi:hypothetical protein